MLDDVGRLTQLAVTDHAAAAASVAQYGVSLLGGVGVVWLLSPDRRLARIAAVAADEPVTTSRLRDALLGTPVGVEETPLIGSATRVGRTVTGIGELAALVQLEQCVAHRLMLTAALAPGPGPVLVVPVSVNEQAVGAVCVFPDAQLPGFDAARIRLLEQVAARAGPALEIARTRTEHERRTEHTRILFTWSQASSRPDGPTESTLQDVVCAAAAAIRGSCVVVQDVGGTLRVAASAGPAPGPVPGEELTEGPGSAILPLRTPDRDFGWLAARRYAPFDEEDLGFLDTLARQIALAWESKQAARERDAALTALRLSEERFRLAFDEAPVGMALIRLQGPQAGSVILANRALADLTGVSQEVLADMRYVDLTRSDEAELDRMLLAEFISGRRTTDDRERRLRRPDGRVVWVQTRLAAIHRNGRPWYAVLHAQDVTSHRTALEQLEHQARHDPLTGLGNRTQLLDHLRLELSRLDRSPGVVAALFLDLDRFKAVNDTRGHTAGDAVLREVAARIAATVRSPDTVARIAGDEFVIAATVSEESDATLLAERIQQALEPSIDLDGDQVPMTASLGVATSRSAGSDPADLLRRADLAMYHAKHDARRDAGPAGVRRWQVYHEALGDQARRRDEVLRMLQMAPDAGWLRLEFQPIVELGTGQVVAAEALLRIRHPVHGLLQPAEFIDVAEAHDVILPIGQWVLTEALHQLRDWHRRHGIEVGVNVSGRQVARRVVGAQVAAAAEAAGYAAGETLAGLRLEVTERVALEADDEVVGDLQRLSNQGVRLSLDDYGTGYASLLHVRRLPVDELKIDHSFVRGLGVNPEDTVIVRAVTALATSLNMGTVAEGVERPEQLPLLRDLGCRRAQGYLFGAPMDAESFGRLLAAGTRASPDNPSDQTDGDQTDSDQTSGDQTSGDQTSGDQTSGG